MKPRYTESQRILLEALIIFALGAVFGLSFHYRLIFNAFAAGTADVAAFPALSSAKSYPVPVSLAQVQDLLAGGALAVDARIPELYREGHLPGAVSLPLVEIESGLPFFRQQIPATKALVVYCNGYACSDSFDLAMLLLRAGYENVRVFEGGLPQWRDAGLPVEEAQ